FRISSPIARTAPSHVYNVIGDILDYGRTHTFWDCLPIIIEYLAQVTDHVCVRDQLASRRKVIEPLAYFPERVIDHFRRGSLCIYPRTPQNSRREGILLTRHDVRSATAAYFAFSKAETPVSSDLPCCNGNALAPQSLRSSSTLAPGAERTDGPLDAS